MSEAEQVAKQYGVDGLSTIRNGQTVTDRASKIREAVGIPIPSNYASSSSVGKKNNEVTILSSPTISVVIDGVKQSFEQSPVKTKRQHDGFDSSYIREAWS